MQGPQLPPATAPARAPGRVQARTGTTGAAVTHGTGEPAGRTVAVRGLPRPGDGLSSGMGAWGPRRLRGPGEGQLFVWRARAGQGHCDPLGIWCRRPAGKPGGQAGRSHLRPHVHQAPGDPSTEGTERGRPQVGLLPTLLDAGGPASGRQEGTQHQQAPAGGHPIRPEGSPGGGRGEAALCGHGSRSRNSARRGVLLTHTHTHPFVCITVNYRGSLLQLTARQRDSVRMGGQACPGGPRPARTRPPSALARPCPLVVTVYGCCN